MTRLSDIGFAWMSQILYNGLHMMILNDDFVLFSVGKSDHFAQNQSAIEIDVLTILSIKGLQLEKDLFGNRKKLFFIIDGKLKKAFKRLRLEDQRSLVQRPEKEIVILSVKVGHRAIKIID